METPQYGPQRTGWVILVLMVVSNFMAWMEPVVGVTSGVEAVSPAHVKMSLGACILAAALVTGTWLTGRHSSSPLPRAVQRPRLVGFRLALAAAAVNIVIGVVTAALEPDGSVGAFRLAPGLQAIWFLFVLPGEVVSAYLTGRGTVRRTASPAPAA